jgi:hypothetical protein
MELPSEFHPYSPLFHPADMFTWNHHQNFALMTWGLLCAMTFCSKKKKIILGVVDGALRKTEEVEVSNVAIIDLL